MRTPSLPSRECVCGRASLHASPSAEQCAPLDPDKPQFPSRSPAGLCLDRAPIEQPSSFVCYPWLTFISKPSLVQPADCRNNVFCGACSLPVHFTLLCIFKTCGGGSDGSSESNN